MPRNTEDRARHGLKGILLLWPLLLLGILWFSHHRAFPAPLYFDSIAHLEERSNLHLTELTVESLSAAMRMDYGKQLYRPLSQLSLAFTHLGFGLAPEAYRFGNLLIHWAASLTLFWMFSTLLMTPGMMRVSRFSDAERLLIALTATILWSLHPIQTNVVAHVVQRMASLSGLFTFASVAAYLKFRTESGPGGACWALLCAVCLTMGLASKESAVTAVPVFYVSEFLLLDPPRSSWGKVFRKGTGWALFLGAIAVAILYRQKVFGLLAYFEKRPFSMGERLLTEARLQLDYLGLLLSPGSSRLVFAPDVQMSTGLLAPPSTAVALALLVSALALAIRFAKTAPIFSFAVFWFVVNQLLEATILPLELYYEHRMYVPSALLYLVIACGLYRLATLPRARVAVAVGVGLFAVAEVWGAYQRTLTWADPVTLWSDTLTKYPESARANTNLGRELLLAGRSEEAEVVLEKALTLKDSKRWIIHNLLARITYERGDRLAAEEHLRKSMADVKRTNWEAPQRLGMIAIQDGRLEEAEKFLRDSLAQRPRNPESWRLLGVTHLLHGRLAESQEALQEAVRFGPELAEGWNTLGALHYKRGKYKEALDCFRAATRLAPERSDFLMNLEKAERALYGIGG